MPRKWAEFREKNSPRATSPEEPIEAVAMRLYATDADFRRLLGWMIDEVSTPAPGSVSDCALREEFGARRFVDKLHSMASGKHDPRNRPDPASGS